MDENSIDIDNRHEDPDFEPQRKKHKKSSDIISNELMMYVIQKFGKAFFTETDKVERKLMCEMMRDDLINEKSIVIEPDIIYENFMSQKRTFLREKKKTSNPEKAKWPFFELFLSLGSCIRSESSTSDRKSSKSSSKSRHKSSSKSASSSSHKEPKKSSSKNSSMNSPNASQIGIKDLFGGSYIETDPVKIETDDKKSLLNISNGPSTSKSFNALQSTPKSVKDNQKETRPRGFLFDNSIDVKDKIGYYFDKYDSDDKSARQVPDDKKIEFNTQNEIKNEAEMVEFLDKLIPKSADKEDAAAEDPIYTQIDPMDYINSSQPESEEIFASQYPETQPFPETQEDEDMPVPNNLTKLCDSDNNNADNNMEEIDPTTDKAAKPMKFDDNNGQEKMIYDSKEQTLNNIMTEVFGNKSFEKINDVAGNAEQIQELKALFNENESQIAAMLEMEEKLFKMQHDIIKSELKFKAKLVQILENIHN